MLDLERAAVEEQGVPGRAATDVNWSWMPHGTPSGEVLGALRREREVEAGEREARDVAQRAARTATSNAALDDRPAPIGTSEAISRSAPTAGRPELGERLHDARDEAAPRRLHRDRVVAPVGGDVDRARRARGTGRRPARRRAPSR